MQLRSFKEQDEASVAPSFELRYIGHGSDRVMSLENSTLPHSSSWCRTEM
jgi:hypothetical protein